MVCSMHQEGTQIRNRRRELRRVGEHVSELPLCTSKGFCPSGHRGLSSPVAVIVFDQLLMLCIRCCGSRIGCPANHDLGCNLPCVIKAYWRSTTVLSPVLPHVATAGSAKVWDWRNIGSVYIDGFARNMRLGSTRWCSLTRHRQPISCSFSSRPRGVLIDVRLRSLPGAVIHAEVDVRP